MAEPLFGQVLTTVVSDLLTSAAQLLLVPVGSYLEEDEGVFGLPSIELARLWATRLGPHGEGWNGGIIVAALLIKTLCLINGRFTLVTITVQRALI